MTDMALRIVGSSESLAGRAHENGSEQPRSRINAEGWREESADGKWQKICSYCRIIALTRDIDSRNWGRLVEVRDPDGRLHRITLPTKLITAKRGEAAIDILCSHGLILDQGRYARPALLHYLASMTADDGSAIERALVATRTGWHDGTFVLPGRSIGGSKVVYQPTSAIVPAIREKGSLEEWQGSVAGPATGNSRLVLAISAAFAPPLLEPLSYPECFGLHLHGDSSTGKTTALEAAGSVWGGGGINGYRQTWRATANGLEAMAEAHSDVLLSLDELAQVKAEDAATASYQLATGIGRQRALADGTAASRREWRSIFLSAGEITLADKLREARTPLALKAGQTVRLVEIPADAEVGLGLFECVPDRPEQPDATRPELGRAFADQMIQASRSFYGTAGPAFVDALISDRGRALDFAKECIDTLVSQMVPADADGQAQRVGRHLALIGSAGELATFLGVVPWQPGEAGRAATLCYQAWLRTRGTLGAFEDDDIVSHLRAVIERDGASRFQVASGGIGQVPVRDRLGYVKEVEEDTHYLIFSEAWKDLWAGRNPDRAARILLERSVLLPGERGRSKRNERVAGITGTQRFYVVSHGALMADGFGEGD